MNRKIWTAIGGAAILAASALPALAAETVTATVTPQLIAVSVTDGGVDYGTLATSGSNNTFNGTLPALGDQQTITNDSNISANMALRSSDAAKTGAAGVTDWALAGTAGSDAFVHSYDIDASGSASWTAFTADGTFDNVSTGTVVNLDKSGGADSTATLDLKLDMPTSTTDITEHSITVTVIATAP